MSFARDDEFPIEAIAAPMLKSPLPGGSAAAVRLDRNGLISDATVSAAAMLGFEPGEMRGRSLKDLALEGWQTAAEVASARVRFGATESFELALRGRSGRRTLVEMTARADVVVAEAVGESAGDPVGEAAGQSTGAVIAWSERRIRRNTAQDGDPELKRIAYGLLRTQEAERMRVALELHDEVAPIVIMVKYMIEDAAGRAGPDASPDSTRILNDAAARLRDVIAELRRISTDLRPRLLDDLGLIPTLEWYCRGVEEAVDGVAVECRMSVAETVIPHELKLDIFRIVQEALSNVLEHAHARRATVSLFVAMGELCLTIEDDGEGFDPGTAASRRDGGLNLGLQSIRKRVEATGGRMQIESRDHGGTRISAAWGLPAPAGGTPR
jgi:two-component system NarL family sensor kinase